MFDLPSWILWFLLIGMICSICWNFSLGKKSGKKAEALANESKTNSDSGKESQNSKTI